MLIFYYFYRQSSKIDQLNAELSRKTATISQLQAEIGAIRSDYDHLLETVSRAAVLGACSARARRVLGSETFRNGVQMGVIK